MHSVLFLHGALGTSAHWKSVTDILGGECRVHEYQFPGHGFAPSEGVQTIDTLAADLKQYIENQKLTDFSLAGYSMGGYVALKLASQGLVGLNKLLTVAVKTTWDPQIAQQEVSGITYEKLQPLASKMELMHGNNWADLIASTASVLHSIGRNPLGLSDMASISIPLRMLVGSADQMVSVDETSKFALSARSGSYRVLPEQGHLLHRMDAELLAKEISDFLLH